MVELSKLAISGTCEAALAGFQAEINSRLTYKEQVAEAKRIWPLRKQNKPFEEVKLKLREMCPGAGRCHYCEDSYADEIEHFRPKDVFPDRTFVWGNYLYACGPCNGPKSNKFAIFDITTKARIDLDILTLSEVPTGAPLLLNPRIENPLDFLFLDINDSFVFTEFDSPGSESYQRASYTIELLRLNSRDDLVKARRNAYGHYRARLSEYITQRDAGAGQSRLDSLIGNLRGEQHPTVWKEMQRQQHKIPELTALFNQAPEAITW